MSKKRCWVGIAIALVCCMGLAGLVGCGGHETRPGVIIAYGETSVEMSPIDSRSHRRTDYRSCNRQDVIEITVGMMCSYPDGPSDLERRAFISTNLDEKGVDPDSYDTLFRSTSFEASFTEDVANGMIETCPAKLEHMLTSLD